jgi:hypothetical protein
MSIAEKRKAIAYLRSQMTSDPPRSDLLKLERLEQELINRPADTRERVVAALTSAGEQAMRNSNMGQIEAYRINHIVALIEDIRTEERERFAPLGYCDLAGS